MSPILIKHRVLQLDFAGLMSAQFISRPHFNGNDIQKRPSYSITLDQLAVREAMWQTLKNWKSFVIWISWVLLDTTCLT